MNIFTYLLESNKSNISKQCLEDSCCDMWPIQHAMKLRTIEHIAFQGANKYLGSVAEDDNTKSDRKWQDVDSHCNLREAPSMYSLTKLKYMI